MKIVAIVHIFYENLWPELEKTLKNISANNTIDIFITSPNLSEELNQKILVAFPAVTFIHTRNVGYDIWPFIKILNTIDLDSYDILIKLHTKRNMPINFVMKEFPAGGDIWRNHLLHFAQSPKNWNLTLKLLSKKNVGIVSDSLCIYNSRWDPAPQHNCQIQEVMKNLGLNLRYGQQFVAGTIFAARPSAFKCLQGVFSENNFSLSDSKHTEGFAHVLERVIGYSVCAQGYSIESFDGKKFEIEIFKQRIRQFFLRERVTTHHTFYHILGIPVWFRRNPFVRQGNKISH